MTSSYHKTNEKLASKSLQEKVSKIRHKTVFLVSGSDAMKPFTDPVRSPGTEREDPPNHSNSHNGVCLGFAGLSNKHNNKPVFCIQNHYRTAHVSLF